jgi:hypothetical protein
VWNLSEVSALGGCQLLGGSTYGVKYVNDLVKEPSCIASKGGAHKWLLLSHNKIEYPFWRLGLLRRQQFSNENPRRSSVIVRLF